MNIAAFSLSPLENHPKAHSISGKTRRDSKYLLRVARSNQVHSGASWRILERSQTEITMARTQLWKVSQSNDKNTLSEVKRSIPRGPCLQQWGWKWEWGDLVGSEKQRRMNYMTNHKDKPYLEEAACLDGSQKEESLRFVNPSCMQHYPYPFLPSI